MSVPQRKEKINTGLIKTKIEKEKPLNPRDLKSKLLQNLSSSFFNSMTQYKRPGANDCMDS